MSDHRHEESPREEPSRIEEISIEGLLQSSQGSFLPLEEELHENPIASHSQPAHNKRARLSTSDQELSVTPLDVRVSPPTRGDDQLLMPRDRVDSHENDSRVASFLNQQDTEPMVVSINSSPRILTDNQEPITSGKGVADSSSGVGQENNYQQNAQSEQPPARPSISSTGLPNRIENALTNSTAADFDSSSTLSIGQSPSNHSSQKQSAQSVRPEDCNSGDESIAQIPATVQRQGLIDSKTDNLAPNLSTLDFAREEQRRLRLQAALLRAARNTITNENHPEEVASQPPNQVDSRLVNAETIPPNHDVAVSLSSTVKNERALGSSFAPEQTSDDSAVSMHIDPENGLTSPSGFLDLSSDLEPIARRITDLSSIQSGQNNLRSAGDEQSIRSLSGVDSMPTTLEAINNVRVTLNTNDVSRGSIASTISASPSQSNTFPCHTANPTLEASNVRSLSSSTPQDEQTRLHSLITASNAEAFNNSASIPTINLLEQASSLSASLEQIGLDINPSSPPIAPPDDQGGLHPVAVQPRVLIDDPDAMITTTRQHDPGNPSSAVSQHGTAALEDPQSMPSPSLHGEPVPPQQQSQVNRPNGFAIRQGSTIRFRFHPHVSNGPHPGQQVPQLIAPLRRMGVSGGNDSSNEIFRTPTISSLSSESGGATQTGNNVSERRSELEAMNSLMDGASVEGRAARAAVSPATANAGPGRLTQITIQGNPVGPGITVFQNANGGQQVLLPQQPGVRHRTLRVAPGTPHVTVPVGAGANIRIQGNLTPQQSRNTDPNNPNIIRRVVVPRLEAQVIPTNNNGHDSHMNVDETEEQDKYRCAICYEFFVDPSSCGKCSSRFCHECLLRVASTPSSAHATFSKCPGCRTLLSVEGIVRDVALREEMISANLQVRCSFPGCDQRLPSALMKDHEQSCPFTPMRCKSATMGCRWTGLRKDLAHHVSHDCTLERVAGFVEQFRQCRSDHGAAIIALQRSQTMNAQLMEVNSGLMRLALPSPTSVIDIFRLVYTSSCTTSYFLYTADIWRSFLVQQGAQESRAMVGNVLYMVPTIFNAIRTAVGGYRLLLTLHSDQDLNVWMGNMELGVLSITPFLLLATAILSLLLDGQSSVKWSQTVRSRFGRWERKVLRDILTIAFLLLNIVVIECDGAGSAALFLWMSVLVSSCCFPPIILTILGLASGISAPNPHQIVSSARTAPVVHFALRHAAIAGFLGVGPLVDCVIVSQLLRRNLSILVRYDLVPVSDGIWSSISSEYLVGFAGIRTALWALESQARVIPWLTIISIVAFLVINFVVHQLTVLGISIGSLVFREGRSNVLPNQLGVRNTCSVSGTLAFCIWASLLMVLAVTF